MLVPERYVRFVVIIFFSFRVKAQRPIKSKKNRLLKSLTHCCFVSQIYNASLSYQCVLQNLWIKLRSLCVSLSMLRYFLYIFSMLKRTHMLSFDYGLFHLTLLICIFWTHSIDLNAIWWRWYEQHRDDFDGTRGFPVK